jgi:hypothetical protein
MLLGGIGACYGAVEIVLLRERTRVPGRQACPFLDAPAVEWSPFILPNTTLQTIVDLECKAGE